MPKTEDEANKKACCSNAARMVGDDKKIARGVCLGSACMAWRWIAEGSLNDERGYCGLAGKPE